MNWWSAALSVAGWLLLFHMLDRWRWSSCRCGRERLPWFAQRHWKEWLMWVFAVLMFLTAISGALTDRTFWAVLSGLVGVWQVRIIYEHRKGKRSVLGRLLGRVKVNHHGRLAVEP